MEGGWRTGGGRVFYPSDTACFHPGSSGAEASASQTKCEKAESCRREVRRRKRSESADLSLESRLTAGKQTTTKNKAAVGQKTITRAPAWPPRVHED